MADVDCPRCGAVMPAGGVCPVCEIPHEESAASRAAERELSPATPGARAWRSGQLALVLAAACDLGALFLPLLGDVAMRDGANVSLHNAVRPLDLALGTFPGLHGQATAWVLPGAAVFMLSLLRSRRTGHAMMATRPLLGVVAILPIVSAVMPFLRFRRLGLSPSPGPALGLVLVGVVLGVIAATRFGEGVPEAPRRGRRVVDDDDDA